MVGYTHRINCFRKVEGSGWTFQTFPTTQDAVATHIRSLYKQQTSGVIRNIELIKLKS